MMFPNRVVWLGIVWIVTAASAVQAQQTPLEKYYAEPPKNLQVIPTDTPRPALIPIMDEFAQALGVQCSYCHVGPQGGCPPTPQGVATCDFITDTLRTKQVARQMLRMVEEINAKVPAAVNKSASDATKVECVTCHRGVVIPKQLNEILEHTASDKGIQAAISQYRDLRQLYYGGQSYNFSENNLITLARPSVAAPPGTPPGTPPSMNKLDESLAWLQLNLEYYPKSVRTYLSLAQAYQRRNDKAAAIKSLEKALEIEPGNAAAKRQLDDLKKP